MDSPEWWERVFEMIASGARPQAVAKGYDTHWQSIWKRIKRDPELERRYYEAKEGRGEYAYFKIEDLAERSENDRVALEAWKYIAQVSNPDRYSEKQHIKLEQSVSKQHVDELRELARLKDVTPEVKKLSE